MKNAPQGDAARDADEPYVPAVAPVPFRIVDFRTVEYGAKHGEFALAIAGVGKIDADLFEPDGGGAFVVARSVREKHSGQWRRTVRFDKEFAQCVLDALNEKRDGSIGAPAYPLTRSATLATQPADEFFDEQERRFTEAAAAFGGAQ